MNSISKLLFPLPSPQQDINKNARLAEITSSLDIQNTPETRELRSCVPSKYMISYSNPDNMNMIQKHIKSDYERKRSIIEYINEVDPKFKEITEEDYNKSLTLFKRKISDSNSKSDMCAMLHPHTTDEDSVDDASVSSFYSISNENTQNLVGVTIPLSFMRELLYADDNIKKCGYFYQVLLPSIGTLTTHKGSLFYNYMDKRHTSEKYYERCMKNLYFQYDDLGKYRNIEDAKKVAHTISKYILKYYNEKYKYREIYKNKNKKRKT